MLNIGFFSSNATPWTAGYGARAVCFMGINKEPPFFSVVREFSPVSRLRLSPSRGENRISRRVPSQPIFLPLVLRNVVLRCLENGPAGGTTRGTERIVPRPYASPAQSPPSTDPYAEVPPQKILLLVRNCLLRVLRRRRPDLHTASGTKSLRWTVSGFPSLRRYLSRIG